MTHTGNFKTDYKVTVIKVVWSGQKSTYLRLMSNILSLRGTKFNSRFKGYKILFIHLYLCQENVFKMKVFITSLNKFFCQTLRATDLVYSIYAKIWHRIWFVEPLLLIKPVSQRHAPVRRWLRFTIQMLIRVSTNFIEST